MNNYSNSIHNDNIISCTTHSSIVLIIIVTPGDEVRLRAHHLGDREAGGRGQAGAPRELLLSLLLLFDYLSVLVVIVVCLLLYCYYHYYY